MSCTIECDVANGTSTLTKVSTAPRPRQAGRASEGDREGAGCGGALPVEVPRRVAHRILAVALRGRGLPWSRQTTTHDLGVLRMTKISDRISCARCAQRRARLGSARRRTARASVKATARRGGRPARRPSSAFKLSKKKAPRAPSRSRSRTSARFRTTSGSPARRRRLLNPVSRRRSGRLREGRQVPRTSAPSRATPRSA